MNAPRNHKTNLYHSSAAGRIDFPDFARCPQPLHLQAESQTDRRRGGSAVYLSVEDADRTHAELRESGARIEKEPQDYPYGLRDFDVRDLDGNRLVIASPTEITKPDLGRRGPRVTRHVRRIQQPVTSPAFSQEPTVRVGDWSNPH